VRASLATTSQNGPAGKIAAILEDLPLICSGQLGDHWDQSIAGMIGMRNGDGSAPLGVFHQLSPRVILALGIGVHIK
jgi:hypothetical protein